MTVLQPGPQGVQSAVVVYGKLPLIVILVIEQVSVSIEQSLDCENLLQFVQSSSFLVQLSGILPVPFRQVVRIVGQPLIAPFIRAGVNGSFPTDLSDAERESRRQREHVVPETVRFPVSVEILE